MQAAINEIKKVEGNLNNLEHITSMKASQGTTSAPITDKSVLKAFKQPKPTSHAQVITSSDEMLAETGKEKVNEAVDKQVQKVAAHIGKVWNQKEAEVA